LVVVVVSGERWALTPSGYRPASCVHGPIPQHLSVVDMGTHSQIRDETAGTLVRIVPPCRIKKPVSGSVASADSKVPFPNGWAAWAWSRYLGGTFTSYNGTWTVPPTPQDDGTQTLFLFTGFQNTYEIPANVTNIIQPVLQWGSSEAGGGKFWALSSWYVDSNGNAFWSQLQDTASGHTIQGNMVLNGKTWTIQSIDMNTQVETTLNIKTNTSEPFAFVTLEVYSVHSCLEYPTGTDQFDDLVFSPSFVPKWNSQVTPGCEESIAINNSSSITVSF